MLAQEQCDDISVASLNPNATTIRVAYNSSNKSNKMAQRPSALKSCEPSAELSRLHKLRDRLHSIQTSPQSSWKPHHFDYRTIVANLSPYQHSHNNVPTHKTTIINNNVHSIIQQWPFMANKKSCDQVTKLSVNGTNLNAAPAATLVASSSSGFGSEIGRESEELSSAGEKCYMLKQFMNQQQQQASDFQNPNCKLVSCVQLNNGLVLSDLEQTDRQSISSECCSLKSCKTYNVNRHLATQQAALDNCHHEQDDDAMQCEQQVETLETCSRAPAWIFNPNDGTTFLLKPPPRPPKPATPETKTEILAESRGGRSYYLELIEPAEKETPESPETKVKLSKKQFVSSSRVPINSNNRSMESLYSRWSSMNTLSSQGDCLNAARNKRKPTQPETTKLASSNRLRAQSQLAKSTPKLLNNPTIIKTNSPPRQTLKKSLSRSERQICPAKLLIDDAENDATGAGMSSEPQVCIPFGLRSKSSNCLATNAVKPSKYSIYGGLRTKDPKVVPRLSYSRAIGPRLQRPKGLQQVKTLPSRYLKMK